MDEPDPQVIAAARGGDMRAFEDLVRHYQAHVWRLCFHLLRDEDLASEATQNAFVRAFRFLPGFKGESRLSTWLFSIARSCVTDELRRLQRRKRTMERVASEPLPPPGRQGSAIEIREAVAMLPIELREPVVLIDMFGLSYAEVARTCEVPIGTIRSRLHRARALLVEALFEEGQERPGEI